MTCRTHEASFQGVGSHTLRTSPQDRHRHRRSSPCRCARFLSLSSHSKPIVTSICTRPHQSSRISSALSSLISTGIKTTCALLAGMWVLILCSHQYKIFSSACQHVKTDQADLILAFERAGLLFVFNFHPQASYSDYGVV